MELRTPLRAHAEWIARFRETLYGRATLTARMTSDDQACGVGQWLSRHQDALGHLREYRVAKKTHEEFHRRACYCLRLSKSGQRSEALAETEDGGELRRLSRLLVKGFQELKRKVRQQRLQATWNVASKGAGMLRARAAD